MEIFKYFICYLKSELYIVQSNFCSIPIAEGGEELECPYKAGELAKITKAVADEGGDISACGTFQLEDTTKGGVILKVRNVDHKILTEALSKLEEVTIIDNRNL